jgi:hypothetical protein
MISSPTTKRIQVDKPQIVRDKHRWLKSLTRAERLDRHSTKLPCRTSLGIALLTQLDNQSQLLVLIQVGVIWKPYC